MADILIIDDEELVRLTLRSLLEQAGHSVREACDGLQAEEMWKAQLPDLMITDLIMPEREGIETIRVFRNEYPDVPLIAISGGGRRGNDDYLAIASAFGATATLQKPFELDELLSTVDEALTSKGTTRTTAA